MTPEDLALARKEAADFLNQTSEAIFAHAEVGSATYLPDIAHDLDIVIRLKLSVDPDDFYTIFLQPKGFKFCGDYQEDAAGKSIWYAVRLGNINFLVTADGDIYQKWLTATEVCKVLRIKDKDQRIAVCQIIRDGKTAADFEWIWAESVNPLGGEESALAASIAEKERKRLANSALAPVAAQPAASVLGVQPTTDATALTGAAKEVKHG